MQPPSVPLATSNGVGQRSDWGDHHGQKPHGNGLAGLITSRKVG